MNKGLALAERNIEASIAERGAALDACESDIALNGSEFE